MAENSDSASNAKPSRSATKPTRSATKPTRSATKPTRRKTSSKPEQKVEFFCSFCSKSQRQVKQIIAGPNVYICDECIELCVEILVDAGREFEAIEVRGALIRVNDLGLNPIFNRIEIAPRENHCFYLGPFSTPYNEIYRDHVVPALEGEGVTVSRADEIFSTEAVIEDIWSGIVGATFIVADLTTKNANVLYEVGMAHTVGRPVIIMTQDMNDVPFDLRHRRCIVYNYTPPGCRQLEEQLAGTARFLLNRSDT
jgi:hypothetical protein